MDGESTCDPRASVTLPTWLTALLVALTIVACAWRMYGLDAPIVDGFWDKQIYVANRARNMAGPLDWLDISTDFLSYDGVARPLTEEVPLYNGIVALGYRWFGEQDWFARLFTSLGCVVAMAGLYALVKREVDRPTALLSAFIFGMCPLVMYYGRAVQPDLWMVGCMLVSTACARRYLDDPRWRWLLASGLVGAVGPLFKYFALIVLMPLAELAVRKRGWRGLLSRGWLVPAAMIAAPIGYWMVAVFAPTPNPSRFYAFFLWQQPSALLDRHLYGALVNLLWKGCGPLVMVLFAAGAWALWRQRRVSRPVASWAVMGLVFWFVMAPKTMSHDYYGLLLMPALAMIAAGGWLAIWGARPLLSWPIRPRAWHGAVFLLVLAVAQSPVVMHRKFDQMSGFVMAAECVGRLCSPDGRVVVGPHSPQPIIHYSHHQGWVWPDNAWTDWRQQLEHYRRLKGEYVVLFFDNVTTAAERAHYREMIDSLPVVEHAAGPWCGGGRPCEFYILSLKQPQLAKRPAMTLRAFPAQPK